MTASFSFRPAKRRMRPLADRFHEKWIPEPNSGCWLWCGAINCRPADGQSGIRPFIGLGRDADGTALAYRVSWELHRGPIPAGMFVCHRCDVPICVNPDHLFLADHAENMADMARKGRGHGPCKSRETAAYKVKLTADDVISIRHSRLSNRQIAERYGVTPAAIYAVRKRQVWRHLP